MLIFYLQNWKNAGKIEPHAKIGDAKFRCPLWTFKQQLAWKMRARCRISLFYYKLLCTVTFGIRLAIGDHQICVNKLNVWFT